MPTPSIRSLHRWWTTKPRGRLHQTRNGDILCGDALEFMGALRDATADVIFLDPPFNLGKSYGSSARRLDRMPEQTYVEFMTRVLAEAERVLKPGGSLFLYHVPRLAIRFANLLERHLIFQHWIAIAMKNGFVRGNHLYPAHYALLHYSKGKPTVANRPKIAPSTCPHCDEYIRDYGGYVKHIEDGVNLTDIWDDLSPVRHLKYKRRTANELPLAIPRRAVAISGVRRGVLVDPFAGTGTALIAARLGGMRFIACDRESENVELMIDRLTALLHRPKLNSRV